MNRCWWCHEDVPAEDSIWLDADGNPVTWEKGTRPANPAPYHVKCAELFREKCKAFGVELKSEELKPAGQIKMFECDPPMQKSVVFRSEDGSEELSVFLSQRGLDFFIFAEHKKSVEEISKSKEERLRSWKLAEKTFDVWVNKAVESGWKLK